METSVKSTKTVIIPETMNGPVGSGHGGASGGVFAIAASFPSASVRFHSPIPLATELAVETTNDGAVITNGETRVATVRPLDGALTVGQFGRLHSAEVAAAEARFLDHHDGDHMAPTCFACGNERTDSFGLNLRPGTVSDTGLMATSWRPQLDTAVPTWMVWAALDCPSGLPAYANVERDEAVVTGELSVETRAVIPGRGEYQVIGRRIARDGRKFSTEAAIVDHRGVALAVATATWIVVPKASLRPRELMTTA